ncbi:MAG: efflux RND transporter periplasmic adaptor subunit [Gemmataceae bacterium]|nr:efflux RND transporter periplasmic adaptor subunit [Gemmataceae bacterium]
MRRAIRWVVFLAVIGGSLYGLSWSVGEWWRKATKPRWNVAVVSRGRVENSVNSTGTVKPVQTVNVGSFVSGPLRLVGADFNQEVEGRIVDGAGRVVKKGTLLAEVDPSLLQAALDRDEAVLAGGKAALEREKANLATQKADLARVQALWKQADANMNRAIALQKTNRDFISQNELDQFTASLESLAAQEKVALATIEQGKEAVKAAAQTVKQFEANLKNSKANRGYCDIYAPEDGVVIERKVDKGQTVAASFQTPELFVIAKDLYKTVHVHASVDEADIGHINNARRLDKPVKFTVDAYPGEEFIGRIFQVRKNSTTTQNVVTYPVVIETGNAHKKLFPGMTATISFEVEVREGVLRLPAAALRFVPPSNRVRDEDRRYLDSPSGDAPKLSATQKAAAARSRSRRTVWVAEGDKLRAVPVVLGLIDNQFAEVLEAGLKEGDEVVTGIDTTPPR